MKYPDISCNIIPTCGKISLAMMSTYCALMTYDETSDQHIVPDHEISYHHITRFHKTSCQDILTFHERQEISSQHIVTCHEIYQFTFRDIL